MSDAANELSNAIASAVETHGPGIVRVEARHRMPSTGLVWSADGLIVTAARSIEREENIEVGLADGRTVSARLVGRDPSTDLAVLKAEAAGLTPARFAELEGLKVGHIVVALGRPGRTVRATIGIVSALGDGDGFRTPAGGRISRYLESDVRLQPGFGGGPLVDLSGRVLGLNTSAFFRRVSLTVPTATIRAVVEKVVSHGGLRRAYLGVGTYPVRLSKRAAAVAGQEVALLVVSVEPDGPSDKAGLLLGDALLALDGRALEEMGDLLETLGDDRVGKDLRAKILRAGQVIELTVTAGARRE
jgi:S1-C subfamily serine protease